MKLSEDVAALVGRCLIGWFFIFQAVQRLNEWHTTKVFVQLKHVPFGMPLLTLSLLAMMLGSFGLVSGFKTKLSAVVLAICTASWIGMAHNFWAIQNAAERSSDFLLFSLGIAIIGGLLCLAASGGRRFALDAIRPTPPVN
jgi:putative oxidoreductase